MRYGFDETTNRQRISVRANSSTGDCMFILLTLSLDLAVTFKIENQKILRQNGSHSHFRYSTKWIERSQ